MVKLGTAALLLALAPLLAGCVSERNAQDLERNEIRGMEIRQLIGEFRYMRDSELVNAAYRLAHMQEFAYPQLREALRSDDFHTRANVIYTFSLVGDRRNIEYIRPLLDDESPVVRYEAASSLVGMGDPTGFATLVEGLADPNIRWRFKCFESLRDATGRDFGYRHDADPTVRAPAVERWRGWLDEHRASAL